MGKVVWSDAASEHLDTIVAYIKLENLKAAQSIGMRLYALGESLAYVPNRGRPVDGFRELVTVSPFILRYAVDGDTVTVVSIRHSRRRSLKP